MYYPAPIPETPLPATRSLLLRHTPHLKCINNLQSKKFNDCRHLSLLACLLV